MEQLQQQLLPLRIQRLKALALQAHQAGAWGQEIGAWQALLGLEPQNAEAGPAISIAQTNLQHAWMYENAIEFVQQGRLAAAKEQLNMLWQVAPDYGDPAGFAEKVGTLPRLRKSYVGKAVNSAGKSFKIEFSSITQTGELVKGNYVGSRSSTFEGTIDEKGIFVFVVAKVKGLDRFKFTGKVQSDDHLAGTWENLDYLKYRGSWEAE